MTLLLDRCAPANRAGRAPRDTAGRGATVDVPKPDAEGVYRPCAPARAGIRQRCNALESR
ncbi:hypothetical protein DF122_29095 [Burkholderia pseudomallei]|nr:hypothetical protein BOC35_13585 [Burkholderia pseudomallei]ARK57223.1 hypothetical protein BOC36_30410 [Burkholderia pseudomallei]ARL19458.1 hypothetical protein BOC46_29505 [Burkholderia pseudomallei]ARL26444.1 hypothetical protein BOC47_30015 [Burkholderia pseudomallei]ARL31997.1 hypothetical protein BOC48_21500 [Burkholderia pseudomallei]